MKTKMKNGGSALIEIVVVSAIISVVSLAFLGTFAAISRFHEKNLKFIKAELIAEEGIEALRSIKDGNYLSLSSLTPGSVYYLELRPSSWGVTTTPEVIDGLYYRSFIPKQGMRDGASDLVQSGGVVDPDTMLFEVYVGWQWRNATNTAVYHSYMMNI